MYETITTSARELRAVFNTYVLPRVRSSEVEEVFVPLGRASQASGQPPGSLSQRLLYLDGRDVIAEAHCFLLPDGSIGASGLPDPKAVLFDGQWLVVEGWRPLALG